MTRLLGDDASLIVDITNGGAPARFEWQGRWYDVSTICNRWRVTSTWWVAAAAASREYFKVIGSCAGDDDLLCTIYRDLTTDVWSITRIYD